MDLSEVTKFVPETTTINRDREYYISLNGNLFIKIDQNIDRARQEAKMLDHMEYTSAWYVPQLWRHYKRGDGYILEMEFKQGITLENLLKKNLLDQRDKRIIIEQLLSIGSHLIHHQIIHGDINVSNLIYDQRTYKVYLVDWAEAKFGDNLVDIYGPPWGLISILDSIK